MSIGLVAFIFGIGAGAWVYNKAMNQTGGNTKTALTTGAVAGAVLAILFFLIMTMLT